MLEQLVELDKELFLYLNGLGTTTWDGFWMFMTRTRNSAPLYLFLLYLVYRNFGPKRTLVVLVAVALLITCTDQLSNFFKYGIGRLRPCHDAEISELMRLVKELLWRKIQLLFCPCSQFVRPCNVLHASF